MLDAKPKYRVDVNFILGSLTKILSFIVNESYKNSDFWIIFRPKNVVEKSWKNVDFCRTKGCCQTVDFAFWGDYL